MHSADSTIAMIDSAIADYETSGDAMRWKPEPEGLPRMVNAAVGLTAAVATLVARRTPLIRRLL